MKTTNFFFENNDGYFTDKTSNSGIKHKGEDLSAIFSDYNNDGYVDLHICNNTGNKIYENLGNGKFSLKEELILSENEDSHKALFLDLDLERVRSFGALWSGTCLGV